MSGLTLTPCDGWIEATLNRPRRRNALSPAIYAGLHQALDHARRDDLAAVIVTGAGGYFCAGGDLSQLAQRHALPLAERRDRIEALHDLIRALRNAPCPVIAAIEGGAAGAGLSLMLACDMIVSARDARFTLAYVRAGLTPDGGALAHLGAMLPRSLAARLALTGDAIGAQRLHDLGVIPDLTDPGAALAGARDLAARLAAGPRRAQARIKALLAPGPGFDAALGAEADAMAQSLADPEARSRIAAILDRRPPATGKATP